jgi:CRISPR-associated exonuclease Cas4
MAWGGLLLSLFLVFTAVILLLLSRRWRAQSGLPSGKVIYADGGAWYQNSDVLTDAALRLAGKPDYLVEQDDGLIIPVEIKSGRAPAMPYAGHVLQLMAYCRLVESAYGTRPTHGILQYSDRAFSIEYTLTLEQDLLDTMQEMRAAQGAPSLSRAHNDVGRCGSCGYRPVCEESLV